MTATIRVINIFSGFGLTHCKHKKASIVTEIVLPQNSGYAMPCPRLMTACVPITVYLEYFLEHHVTTRQQAIMEKKNNNLQT